MQKNETKLPSYTTHKNELNWITDLKIRPENTELLDGNISGKLLDIVLADDFF